MRLSEYIFWLFGTLMLIAILDRFSAAFNHLAAVGAARWWDSFRDSWRLLTPPSVPIRFPPPRLLTKSLEKCSKMMRGRRNDSRLPIIRFLVLLTPYLTRETVNFPRSGSCVVYSQNLIFIMMNISCRLVKTSGGFEAQDVFFWECTLYGLLANSRQKEDTCKPLKRFSQRIL